MSAHVLSHLECDPAAARLDHLVVGIAGQELSSPSHVPEWDYETPLEVRADVTVDLQNCLESAGLGQGSELGMSVVWHATGSGLRGVSEVHGVRDGVNTVVTRFDGTDLGGTLVLHLVITLLRADRGSEDLAARRPGSLLWSEERRIRLEGAGSRFPITHVSFASSGLVGGLKAAWALIFESTDLYDSGLGNVRLYLNTDHETVENFIAQPTDSPTLELVLRSDVNRQIVLQALQADELDIDSAYPSESMGEMLVMSLKRNFPNLSVEEVRSLARNSPGEFEGHLQARGGFLQ